MTGEHDAVFAPAAPITADGLKSLRSEVVEAARSSDGRITIDLDDVGILDSRLISTLISILRDVRQLGAEVTLRARRPGILDTLRVTALDRVFTIEVASSSGASAAAKLPLRTVPRAAARSPRGVSR